VGVDAESTDGRTGFGDLLRRHRRRVGLSQEALAEVAGLSRRGVADLERGARRFPYPDTVRRLADALELDTSDREVFVGACRQGPRAKRRHVLPIEPTPIVGRDRELAHVIRLAKESRLLTLTGTGGIGKSRLVTELAHRTESQFAEGAAITDLALAGNAPDAVQAAVARSLGVLCPPGEPAAGSLLRYLESKHVLLVLDNCEHVAGGSAELAAVLLRACLGVSLVVTSREPLRIPGETVWLVPPMATEESVTLFVQRARAAGAADMRTVRDLELVAQIARRLEGVPLAIELTVARVPALGLTQVARQLADRMEFLSHGGRLNPPRHHTLRAAFDWSWELLTPTEQLLFPRLAVFAGGWALEAAQEVCAGPGLEGTVVMDGLAGLVEKSLVLTADDDGQRRFRLLDTVRDYGRERLADSGHEAEVAARHARYFRTVAADGPDTRRGLHYPADAARIEREHANVTAALGWHLTRHDVEHGAAMCQSLGGFWLAQGFLREGQQWLSRFLSRPEELTPQALAGALHTWGRLAEYSGDLDHARDLFERSLSINGARGEEAISARALCALGDVALHHGGLAEARDRYLHALQLVQDDQSPEHAQALVGLARVDGLDGDLNRSTARLEEALSIQRRQADWWGVAYALNELGQQARRAGKLTEAQSLLEECHTLWRQTGTRMGERAAVMNLTLVVLELGAVEHAAELARESIELSDGMHDDGSATTVRCIEIAALVLEAMRSTDTAVGLLAAATRRREELAAPRPGAEESDLAPALEEARTALGTERFDSAWARGRDLTMLEALAVATEALTVGAHGMASGGPTAY